MLLLCIMLIWRRQAWSRKGARDTVVGPIVCHSIHSGCSTLPTRRMTKRIWWHTTTNCKKTFTTSCVWRQFTICVDTMKRYNRIVAKATDAYKKLLLENREFAALNVYVALCYYKMEYYDVSIEILQSYLNSFPTSVTAVNLKACN